MKPRKFSLERGNCDDFSVVAVYRPTFQCSQCVSVFIIRFLLYQRCWQYAFSTVSSSQMRFTSYISSPRHLFITLRHFIRHSSLVTRRSSSRHLFIAPRHSSFVVLHSSLHPSLHSSFVTRHFVTSFITRHSSVTSHAPSQSYKRARAVAVGYIYVVL